MSRNFGALKVTVLCSKCGFNSAEPCGENLNRCDGCGRFAEDKPDVCCLQHRIAESPYPTGECPRCQQERDRRAAIEHEVTRDPQVEPW